MPADPTDFGEKAFSAAHNLLRRGQEVARREARVLRLQTQISRLRAQRQRLLQQMGEKVLDLFQRDLVKNQDLRLMCQQIRGIDAEIELRREEVEQLRRPAGTVEEGIGPEGERVEEAAVLDEDEEIIRD